MADGGVRAEKAIYCGLRVEKLKMIGDVQRVLAERLFAAHELDVWWPAGEYVPPAGQALEVTCYLQKRTTVLAVVGKNWLAEFAKWKAREVARVTGLMWGWAVPRAVGMCTVRGYRPERVVAWARGGMHFVPKRTELRVELLVQDVAVVSGVFVRKGRMRVHRLKAQVYAGPASSRWWRRELAADAWECEQSEERAEAVETWKEELGEELGAWCRAQSAVLCG